MIPYGHQSISEEDIAAVVETLRSDWLTQGPTVERFEQALAAYCGVAHAVAVCNGTAALHLACRAAHLAPGRRLWTSPITFVASANCGLYCGAAVDFVDVDAATGCMDMTRLEVKLEAARQDRALPDVVVPVHYAGQPCDMGRLDELARRYRFTVVEDAAHALGASFDGKKIGACDRSRMAILSFHPVKPITTGEGGAILTNDRRLADRLRRLRSHGITKDSDELFCDDEGPWFYEMQDLGYNYRLTDLQSALGLTQLPRLDGFVAARRRIAARYDAAFSGLAHVRPVAQEPGRTSAHHLYVLQIDFGRLGKPRREVVRQLAALGVGTQVHYIPVHMQPYYRQRCDFAPEDFPVARRFYEQALSLPLFAAMTDEQTEQVIAAVCAVLGGTPGKEPR